MKVLCYILFLLNLEFLPFSKSFWIRCSNNRKLTSFLCLSSTVSTRSPRVEVEYCTGCRWLLRSSWIAQEILSTFDNNVGEVALIPCKLGAGTFIIRVDGEVIWNRSNKETPGFPELKNLKQLIRNRIAPDFSLGHSEKKLET